MERDSGKIDESIYRISKTTAYLMIGTAFFFDVVEMVLAWTGIGVALDEALLFVFGLTFWLWFAVKDVPFLVRPSRFLTFAATFIFEAIPALDAIPVLGEGWTVGITILVLMVRFEDRTGIKLPSEKPKLSGVVGLKEWAEKAKLPASSGARGIKTPRPKVSDLLTDESKKAA